MERPFVGSAYCGNQHANMRLIELEALSKRKRPDQSGLISHFYFIDGPVIHMRDLDQSSKTLKRN